MARKTRLIVTDQGVGEYTDIGKASGGYSPLKQTDYLYSSTLNPSDYIEFESDTGYALLTRNQYVDWVTGKYGTYEAWLNKLTARDRKTHASYGPSRKAPFWGATEAEYHRIVRANQRRFDGQPPVDEAGSPIAAMSGSDTTAASGGTKGAGSYSVAHAENWIKQNKGAVIGGVAALALLIVLARKR